VIDDDPASRYLVEHTLAPSGCVVAHATSGQEGLQRARELRPSAIFLDLGLPDISGLDVLQELKAIPEVADRPIIIYTSRPVAAEERRLLSGFALQVVSKDDPDLGQALGSLGAALVRATEHRLQEGA
jgi:CheY-like chemotaxis protein